MRKLTLSLAVMAALLPARGYPLGLGEIELNSALNQELNAEIEVLSASSDDANQMIVQLANRDAFNRAGIDRPYLLQQLQFKIVEKQGKPFVKVFTKSAIREPYISFLLEIDWPQGHLLREYTLLLDPPVYNTSTGAASTSSEQAHPFIDPADVRAHTQSVAPQQQGGQSNSGQSGYSNTQSGTISSNSGRSVTYSAPQSNAARFAPTTQRSTSAVSEYRVKQSDTLWSVANRMRPDNSVSVEQMMLALVRKNPEAFINENINGVKRGYILRMPDRNEATQLDRQQAISQAKEHATLWREYSQAAVSQAPASSMEAAETSVDGMATADAAAAGHLSIVGASKSDGSEHAGANQDPDSEVSRLKQELAMAREQLESERIEKEGLRTKLSDLEQKVQSVIQMDDGELAKLQQDLQQQQAESAEQSEAEQTVAEAETTETVEEDAAAAEAVTEEVAVEADAEVTDEVAEPIVEAEEAVVAEDAVFVDELEVVEEGSEVEAAADTTETVGITDTAEVVEPPAFAQQKPKSFIDSLMSDPKLLGMIGGGLAFVLLLVVLLLKRLRGGKAESQDESLENDFLDINDATVQAESLDLPSSAETDDLSMADTQIDVPAMNEDSLEDALLGLDDAEAAKAAADQQDDVMAEADVYIAYGIYQQAEDLLKNAIDQNPDRDDYRMKLMETYFAAKDAKAFEQEATQLKLRKGDDASYWGRVATMGTELCPGSDLFFGSDEVIGDLDVEALASEKPETTDLELDATNDDESVIGLDTLGIDLGATTEFDALSDDLSDDMGLGDESGLDEGSSFESSDTDGLDLAGDLADIANEVEKPLADSSLDDEAASLEFDLGELTDETLDNGPNKNAEAVSAEDEMDDLDIDEDFSLDFAASDLGFEEPEEEAALDTPVDDIEDLDLSADLDLGTDLDEPSSIDVVDESLVDDESMEVDFTADLGDSLDEDLGEIDLDDSELELDSDLNLDELADASGLSSEDSASGDEDFDISELSEDLDEVGTKLDLAKAYIDMGDHEGARSILEEVKTEGNAEQQQEAESLLTKAG